MSVRAHRVTKLEWADPTWNAWGDTDFTDYLDKNEPGWGHSLDMDGCGITDISVKVIKQYIKDAKKSADAYLIEALRKDVAAANKLGDEWIRYYLI